MNRMQTQELVSALADGQLRGADFASGVVVAAADPAGREAWRVYHLIGDVLRSGELAAGAHPEVFLGRLKARLQQEQRPLAELRSVVPVSLASEHREAANDTTFRWKLVAAFASVAAVCAITWSLVGGIGGGPEQAQLASRGAGGTIVAPSDRGMMIRDPQLDELLAAHRQLGSASVLQMPAEFVRNATFEAPAR